MKDERGVLMKGKGKKHTERGRSRSEGSHERNRDSNWLKDFEKVGAMERYRAVWKAWLQRRRREYSISSLRESLQR